MKFIETIRLHDINIKTNDLVNCENGKIVQLSNGNYVEAEFLIFLKNNNSIDIYYHKQNFDEKKVISKELVVNVNFLNRLNVDSFEVLLTKGILKISIISGNEMRIVFASIENNSIKKVNKFESTLIHGKYQGYTKHSLLVDNQKGSFILATGRIVKFKNNFLSNGDMIYMDPIGNINKVTVQYSGNNCKFIHIHYENVAEICDNGIIRSRKFSLKMLRKDENILSYTNKINLQLPPNKLESFGWMEHFISKQNRISVTIDI
uniref:Conserved domain protein n=1 Tax=Strongyloides papillosus TaxID=174720 RepID=A0A0N5BEK2_STREA